MTADEYKDRLDTLGRPKLEGLMERSTLAQAVIASNASCDASYLLLTTATEVFIAFGATPEHRDAVMAAEDILSRERLINCKARLADRRARLSHALDELVAMPVDVVQELGRAALSEPLVDISVSNDAGVP